MPQRTLPGNKKTHLRLLRHAQGGLSADLAKTKWIQELDITGYLFAASMPSGGSQRVLKMGHNDQ